MADHSNNTYAYVGGKLCAVHALTHPARAERAGRGLAVDRQPPAPEPDRDAEALLHALAGEADEEGESP